jgi:hypothetical protein
MDLGDYVEVKDRLRAALERYPHLRVVEEHATITEVGDRQFLICRVAVHRTQDDPLPMVAAAWEPLPGRTPYTKDSELMVGMTSALGRALGYMGFGITKSIASANEVEARQDRPQAPTAKESAGWNPKPLQNRPTESPQIDANTDAGTPGAGKWNPDNGASEKQKRAIYVIAKKKGIPMPDVNVMTMAEAGAWIEEADAR